MRTSHTYTHGKKPGLPLICGLVGAILLGVTALLAERWSHRTTPTTATQPVSDARAKRSSPATLTTAQPDRATRAQIKEAFGKLPLSFELNQGQTDAQAKFISRGNGYTLFLTNNEAVLSLVKFEAQGASHKTGAIERTKRRTTLHMKLAGANPAPEVAGLDQLPGKSNYFIGKDPTKWRTNVSHYAKVEYKGIYPGVDLVYYGNQRQLEYDFVVAPGADPGLIKLRFEGAKKLSLDERGDLVLRTANGDVRQRKPVVYQEANGVRQEIASRYVLRGQGEVSFEVGAYDPSQTLTIDPVLNYSTFFGGSDHDDARAVAVDDFGNAYVTGSTDSVDFPTTAGAFDTVFNENGLPTPPPPVEKDDAYVVKLNPMGTAIVYSTYLGGGVPALPPHPLNALPSLRGEEGNGIALDAAGNAHVVGTTDTNDFPTTPNAFINNAEAAPLAGPCIFITKLNAEGSALLYSSYLGGGLGPNPELFPGTLIERGTGIAVCPDGTGTAWITGYTNSANFPTTPNSVQPTKASDVLSSDAFVSGFNTLATPADRKASLIYSTYLGGKTGTTNVAIPIPVPPGTIQSTVSTDQIQGIAIDSSCNIHVTGHTTATDFPVTPNALKTTFTPPPPGFPDVVSEAFVAKIRPSGQGNADLLYSTFLGGSSVDIATGIAVDPVGLVYVTGITASTNFPTKNGSQNRHGGGRSFDTGIDAFLTKLDTNKSGANSLLYSTFLGGDGEDFSWSVAADCNGVAFLAGNTIFSVNNATTRTNSFPTTPDALDRTFNGISDGFVVKIDTTSSGSASFVYSTFLGGSGSDFALGIALDPGGSYYVVGFTDSADFPIRPGAFQATIHPGNPPNDPDQDAFIVKFCEFDKVPSDQRAGSVLVYNLYSSIASSPNLENTRINLTNTNDKESVAVHLFFVDGNSCSVADAAICLTPNQTASFLASDIDPGVMGYIVAVAVDSSGCPRSFNFLIGDEYVKLASGHAANFGAEAFAAGTNCDECKSTDTTTTLKFDGITRSLAPRVLALNNIPSPADGNSTLLVVNRLGGDLSASASTLGSLFGILYDDAENAFSFTVSGRCQLKSLLSNSFPRTTPRFTDVIPAGRSGWMKLWTAADAAILGAAINFNPNAISDPGAFNQGHNLHILTLTDTARLTIPVFPPPCE
jgi:hypothetical protein